MCVPSFSCSYWHLWVWPAGPLIFALPTPSKNLNFSYPGLGPESITHTPNDFCITFCKAKCYAYVVWDCLEVKDAGWVGVGGQGQPVIAFAKTKSLRND